MFEALSAEIKALFTSEVKKVHDDVRDIHVEVLSLPESIEARLVGAFKEVQEMTKNDLIAALNELKTGIEAKFADLRAQIASKDTTIKGLQDAASASTEDADLSAVGDVVKGISDSLKDGGVSTSTSGATASGDVTVQAGVGATGTGFDSVAAASTTDTKPASTMAQMPASTLAASGGITDENPGPMSSAANTAG